MNIEDVYAIFAILWYTGLYLCWRFNSSFNSSPVNPLLHGYVFMSIIQDGFPVFVSEEAIYPSVQNEYM